LRGIENALLVSPDGVTPGSVAIEDGRVAAIGGPGFVGGPDVPDAGGLHLLPGVIDPEAHRKGAIRVGSDADLVLVDLQKRMTLGRDLVLSGSGWTLYEDMEVTGWPVLTVLRGEVAAEWTANSCWIAPEPCGRFVGRREMALAAGA